MKRAAPRRNYNSSRLVHLLADLAVADVAEAKQSFAERLGEWLGVADAITLHAALNPSAADARSGAALPASVAVREEFARVRTALVNSVTTESVLTAGNVRVKLPSPDPGASIESAADFSPYRRYYLAHQGNMDSSIGLLRANVRAAISSHSAPLKRLAALDAALDQALSVRERNSLSAVPVLLERRFEHLRRTHRAADNPDPGIQPGGWLAVFRKDMRAVLLAELDVRLQPVLGLVEAFGNGRRR